MDIRAIIARELDRQQLTRAELANRAGMTAARVSDYLNGKRDVYGETIERMLTALGLTITSKTQKRKG